MIISNPDAPFEELKAPPVPMKDTGDQVRQAIFVVRGTKDGLFIKVRNTAPYGRASTLLSSP